MFDHIVSMGCACGTARSMEKYGLRNWSGPFDWYVSNFASLIHFMETDFSDFLDKENLKIADKPNEFYDEKYDCYFANDVMYDFNEEWEEIYSKYRRRIERFLSMIQYPTCFVRCIRDEKEEKYIYENHEHILSVIRKCNQSNQIIFLGGGGEYLEQKIPFKYFSLNLKDSDAAYSLMIGRDKLFDRNCSILKFLCEGMDAQKVISNLFFYKEKIEKTEMVLKCRYDIATKLLLSCSKEKLYRLPKELIIYGAGKIGKAFYEKCMSYCNVESFVDRHPYESSYRGIKVVHYTDIGSLKGKNIVITPVYDIEKISKVILKYKPDANVISLNDVFH